MFFKVGWITKIKRLNGLLEGEIKAFLAEVVQLVDVFDLLLDFLKLPQHLFLIFGQRIPAQLALLFKLFHLFLFLLLSILNPRSAL